MKSILIGAALLAPLAAFANDGPKVESAYDKKTELNPGLTSAANPTNEVAPAMSRSQVLDKLHKVSRRHSELGNLAQTRASNEQVKELGRQLTRQFTTLDAEVVAYARDQRLPLVDASNLFGKKQVVSTLEDGVRLDESPKSRMERLGKLSGPDFDAAFLTSTVEGCQRLLPVLEQSKGTADRKFDVIVDKAIGALKDFQRDAWKLQSSEGITPAS